MSVSPSASTSSEAESQDRVAPAQPTRLEIPAIGLTAKFGKGGFAASYYRQNGAEVYDFLPPESDLSKVWWWNQRSEPSFPSTGTSYVFGHTCHSRGCPAAFNSLQELDGQIGAVIRIVTPNGILTYRVAKTITYRNTNQIDASLITENRQGQLVLVTCKLRGHEVQSDRFVVVAQMVSSQRV